MEGTVIDGGFEVNHRITGQKPFQGGLKDPFFHRRDVLARNDPADNLILEAETFTARQRSELHPAVAILAAAARLLLILPLDLDRSTDGLQIRDLGGL